MFFYFLEIIKQCNSNIQLWYKAINPQPIAHSP